MTAAIGAEAKKIAEKKVAQSQAAKKAAGKGASSGEKAAKTAADREARLKRVANARARVADSAKDQVKTATTSGPGSPKKAAATQPAKRPAAQRAVSTSKSAAKQRVESAKTSRKKTATAVESKYRSERVLGLAEIRPKTRMLAAEYMAAMAIAIIILFHDDGKSTYHQRMAKFFIQMTGITGLFFVLSLTATSERVSRYAIPFGLLVDVSMVIFAFKSGAGQVFGQALGVTPKETPEQIQHRLDVANPDAQPDLIAPGLIISPPTVPRSIPAFGTDLNPTPKIQNPLFPVPGGNTPSSPTIPNPLFPGPGGN